MATPITSQSRSFLTDQLIRQEAFKQFPCKDTNGNLTVAIGRNLDAVGVSFDEALLMCKNDIDRAEKAIINSINLYDSLNEPRKCVLINMTFNMGINDVLKFKKMLNFLNVQDYINAAQEMLNSKWAKEVGQRAITLSNMMESGEFP